MWIALHLLLRLPPFVLVTNFFFVVQLIADLVHIVDHVCEIVKRIGLTLDSSDVIKNCPSLSVSG
jgi:hypothetical protein